MPHILYIDTATDTGTVALSTDNKLLTYAINEEARNHAGTINDMIAKVLADAGVTMADVSAVTVCAGPGSYTGLRIGMATAKGLCYATGKPLLLQSRLTLLAHQLKLRHSGPAARYIALLKAREKEYFITIYNENFECTLAPRHITEAELNTVIESMPYTCLITDADEGTIARLQLADAVMITDIKIDMGAWCIYAFKEFECNNTVNLASAEPFYLKQVYTHN